jgi:hypothetical protein
MLVGLGFAVWVCGRWGLDDRARLPARVSTLETAVSELRAMLDRSNAHLKPALRHSNDAERRIREARGHMRGRIGDPRRASRARRFRREGSDHDVTARRGRPSGFLGGFYFDPLGFVLAAFDWGMATEGEQALTSGRRMFCGRWARRWRRASARAARYGLRCGRATVSARRR